MPFRGKQMDVNNETDDHDGDVVVDGNVNDDGDDDEELLCVATK